VYTALGYLEIDEWSFQTAFNILSWSSVKLIYTESGKGVKLMIHVLYLDGPV
jgi:hypothetical protein